MNKNRKKGFTLIELLAVIVILAVIALIATPIILDLIENSKDSSIIQSGEMYLDSVEQAIVRTNLNEKFNPTTCNVLSSEVEDNGVAYKIGDLLCDTGYLKVDLDKTVPTKGALTLNNGQITNVVNLKINGKDISLKDDKLQIYHLNVNYTITFNSNGGTSIASQTIEEGGKIVKPTNPTNNKLLFAGWYNGDTKFDFNSSVTSNLTLSARWGTSSTICVEDEQLTFDDNPKWNTTKYTCDVVGDGTLKVFYLLSTNEDGSLNLIMGENLPTTTKWVSTYTNSLGPVLALQSLHDQTKTWRSELVINEYTYDVVAWRNSSSNPYTNNEYGYKTYTISNGVGTLLSSSDATNTVGTTDSPIKSRLLTAEEMVAKGCLKYASDGSANGSCPEWLYKPTNADGTYGSGAYHWSLSPGFILSGDAVSVGSDGIMSNDGPLCAHGVRPVITVLISNVQ